VLRALQDRERRKGRIAISVEVTPAACLRCRQPLCCDGLRQQLHWYSAMGQRTRQHEMRGCLLEQSVGLLREQRRVIEQERTMILEEGTEMVLVSSNLYLTNPAIINLPLPLATIPEARQLLYPRPSAPRAKTKTKTRFKDKEKEARRAQTKTTEARISGARARMIRAGCARRLAVSSG
jgi:hypothetical protein